MMTLHPEILVKDGKKQFAVLPYEEFVSLKERLEDMGFQANKRDVPYQTLLKLFVLERVQTELHLKTAKPS